jgi:decaprenylphospho-beta-D-ribofuranose 2-oxidase
VSRHPAGLAGVEPRPGGAECPGVASRPGIPAPLRQSRFVSFDGAVSLTTSHQRPDRYRHLEADLGTRKRIARGAGLSYAAASFGDATIVQEMRAFNRLLRFDAEQGTVTVEAGLPVGDLLAWTARHGLYIPVLPGYPTITVGGCIAADIHGKNPLRDGTFSDWVESLTLYHPALGFHRVDAATMPDRFAATCGGFGLTGTIIDATLRLIPLPAHHAGLRGEPVGSLGQSIAELHANPEADFGYSWHDGAARGSAFGRGVVFFGSWTDAPGGRADHGYRPMSSSARARIPLSMWNPVTVRLANAWFRHDATRGARVTPLFRAMFPFATQTSYHRFYGRPGLAEVQVLVPDAGVDEFVQQLTRLVQRIDPPLVMMSVKLFRGRQRSLSVSGAGALFALDLRRTGAVARFLAEFDALMLATGAQPNLAKDSRLPAGIAARALPGYDSFRSRLWQLDPDRLYQSELSQRLHL